eukprot:4795889-Prymnesium_polylepis.1
MLPSWRGLEQDRRNVLSDRTISTLTGVYRVFRCKVRCASFAHRIDIMCRPAAFTIFRLFDCSLSVSLFPGGPGAWGADCADHERNPKTGAAPYAAHSDAAWVG